MGFLKHLLPSFKQDKHYGFVLVGLVVGLVAYPLCVNFSMGRILLNLWLMLTLIQLILSHQVYPAHRIQSIFLGSLSLILSLLSVSSNFFSFQILHFYKLLLPFSALFFFYCVWVITSSIFNQRRVTLDLIYGSVLAYILIGVSWALIFCCIELFVADSFSFSSEVTLSDKTSALIYFSFVTLTTLGYGDVLPVTTFAKTVAYLEAITGVMYPAILISTLVGKFKLSNPEE